MRHAVCLRALAAGALLLMASGAAHAETTGPRVRAVDARAAALLLRGAKASPTLASLVHALQETDVIVHVEADDEIRGGASGATRFVAKAGEFRYLRIGIASTVRGDSAVALLGHELYHAWEIAQARWVDNVAAVEALYEQIGHTHRDDGLVRADSPAARRTGRRVRDELVAFRSGD